jgi:hypothetical protein
MRWFRTLSTVLITHSIKAMQSEILTFVQTLRLCTSRTAHRGSRCIALLFYDHGTRRGEGSASRPGRSLPSEKNLLPIVQEAGWPPGPVWTDAENLASTGIRSSDLPSRSQPLYRLCYPAHEILTAQLIIQKKFILLHVHYRNWAYE